jgi:hypothetical protein
MSSRELLRGEWQAFCDRISKVLSGAHAEVEIVSLDLGDQIEAKWSPLFGIVYDPKSDVFEIALDGVDHLISRPRRLLVEETPRGIVAFEITADDTTRQIVRLREPLPAFESSVAKASDAAARTGKAR